MEASAINVFCTESEATGKNVLATTVTEVSYLNMCRDKSAFKPLFSDVTEFSILEDEGLSAFRP
ncbi:hypothetical protein ACPCXA_08025 [Lysinibacillus agricola]